MNNFRRENIIQMFHVSKRFGNRDVIKDITLTVAHNEFLFVSGRSGAGKSTMLKLLYMYEPISKGQIIIDGINMARINYHNVHILRRRIGIVFQDFKLIPTRTVYDNVALVLEAQGFPRKNIEPRVKHMLQSVGMLDLINEVPPSLSGGEQQRVSVARAMIANPSIILADEPTGSLDPESAVVIMNLLNAYHSKGGTVIIATHDRALIESTTNRVVYIQNGTIQELENRDTNEDTPQQKTIFSRRSKK